MTEDVPEGYEPAPDDGPSDEDVDASVEMFEDPDFEVDD